LGGAAGGVATAISTGSFLLVEDDGNDVLLIQRAFRQGNIVNGLQVVRDGEQAIAYLRGDGEYADRRRYPLPVLVLLDLKLPRRSGHEVLQWLKGEESLRRTPVVVLTSSAESSDVNRAYDLGANSYLVKPVTFESLLELVKTLGMYWVLLNQPPDPESGG
jgi:CheY-like chemotaxis protein